MAMAEGEKPEQSGGFEPDPGKDYSDRFRIGGKEAEEFFQPLNLLGGDEEEKRRRAEEEQEFRGRSEFLGREEQFSRRDPELQLILFPESPKDIDKAVTGVLERYTDFDLKEASSPYRLQYYMDAAESSQFVFGHSRQELQDQGYVQGEIGEDGYLSEGGKPKKFGFAIKVDTEQKPITVKELRERQHEPWTEKTVQTHMVPKFDPEGKIESWEPVQVKVEIEHPQRTEKWVEVSKPTIRAERFYYGTDNKRKELYNASRAAFERLVNTARMHDLFTILESNRADISGLVTILYLKANHISNDQWKQIFNAPDIGEITEKNLENNGYGSRIDKAMRMMDLLGHAERRGRISNDQIGDRDGMEEFMNKPTFEKIVEAAKVRALELMEELDYEDGQAKTDEEKIARFLVGKGAVKRDGRWVLEGWFSNDERDPSKGGDGFDALKKEKFAALLKKGKEIKADEKDVRGFLTEYGNVYARAGDFNAHVSIMHERIRFLLGGDRSAIRDADRITQLTGLRDEWNLEVLASEMPSAEDIIEAHKIKKKGSDYGQWREKAKEWLDYFKLPGDPTGSDLSKIFYPQFYRLKDILKDRPAGPLLTTFDYDRFAQSMFSLGRSEVIIPDKVDDKGEPVKETRSLLEQWRGYAKEGDLPREKANDLGDIKWDDIQVPGNLEEVSTRLSAEFKEEWDKKVEAEKHAETKEKLKKFMEASVETVGGKSEIDVWSYYTLMNWLAGRDNKIKAPWPFILDETENLRVLNLSETYTNKDKFLDIVWHGPAIVWGQWRGRYEEFENREEAHGLSPEEMTEKLNKHLRNLARQKVEKGKRDWYKGIRNLVQFPEVMAQRVKRVEAMKAGGTGENNYTLLRIVEGTQNEPGIAPMMGFMTMEDLKEDSTKRYLREQDLRIGG